MSIADRHSARTLRRFTGPHPHAMHGGTAVAAGGRRGVEVAVENGCAAPAAAATAAAWLVVTWEVSDEDLRGVLEWRILEESELEAGQEPAAVAVWRPASGAADGSKMLAELAQNPGAVIRTHDPVRGLEHIDIPGLLALTIRRQGGEGVIALYARTTALSALGVRGGRADCPQARVVRG